MNDAKTQSKAKQKKKIKHTEKQVFLMMKQGSKRIFLVWFLGKYARQLFQPNHPSIHPFIVANQSTKL